MEEFIINLLKTGLGGFISVFLFAIIFLMPRWLWRRAKGKRLEKSILEKSSVEGLTPLEYALQHTSESHIKVCEFYRGNAPEIKAHLDALLKAKKISKECYAILLEEYSKKIEDAPQPKAPQEKIEKNEVSEVKQEEHNKMYCQYCGKELSQHADVCLNCGAFVSPQKKKRNKLSTVDDQQVYKVLSIVNFVFCILDSIPLIFYSMIGETFYLYTDIHKDSSGYWGYSEICEPMAFVITLIVMATMLIFSLILFGKTKRKLDVASIFIAVSSLFVSSVFAFICILN